MCILVVKAQTKTGRKEPGPCAANLHMLLTQSCALIFSRLQNLIEWFETDLNLPKPNLENRNETEGPLITCVYTGIACENDSIKNRRTKFLRNPERPLMLTRPNRGLQPPCIGRILLLIEVGCKTERANEKFND